MQIQIKWTLFYKVIQIFKLSVKNILFAQSFIIAVHGQYHFVTCITYIDKKLKI